MSLLGVPSDDSEEMLRIHCDDEIHDAVRQLVSIAREGGRPPAALREAVAETHGLDLDERQRRLADEYWSSL